MWGNFDLGKLGEQLTAVAGEALQKATADVEKSIDNTLGIKGGNGPCDLWKTCALGCSG